MLYVDAEVRQTKHNQSLKVAMNNKTSGELSTLLSAKIDGEYSIDFLSNKFLHFFSCNLLQHKNKHTNKYRRL